MHEINHNPSPGHSAQVNAANNGNTPIYQVHIYNGNRAEKHVMGHLEIT